MTVSLDGGAPGGIQGNSPVGEGRSSGGVRRSSSEPYAVSLPQTALTRPVPQQKQAEQANALVKKFEDFAKAKAKAAPDSASRWFFKMGATVSVVGAIASLFAGVGIPILGLGLLMLLGSLIARPFSDKDQRAQAAEVHKEELKSQIQSSSLTENQKQNLKQIVDEIDRTLENLTDFFKITRTGDLDKLMSAKGLSGINRFDTYETQLNQFIEQAFITKVNAALTSCL